MIHIQIILPDGMMFKETANEMKILLEDGWMGIRENHSPVIAKLKDGEIQFIKEASKQKFLLSNAFIRFLENEAVILAQTAQIV